MSAYSDSMMDDAWELAFPSKPRPKIVRIEMEHSDGMYFSEWTWDEGDFTITVIGGKNRRVYRNDEAREFFVALMTTGSDW